MRNYPCQRTTNEYTESVKDRITGCGALVDILFLNDEALFTKTFFDLVRRESLYGVTH